MKKLPKGAEYFIIFPVYCKKVTRIRQGLLGVVDYENESYLRRKKNEYY
jgi:hypothetical protein